MTQEDKLYADAIEYRDKYWKNRSPQIKEAAEFGYIVGAKSILESEEYRQLVIDAQKWRDYNEEMDSLRKKMSTQWDKVEKWDEIVKVIEDLDEEYKELWKDEEVVLIGEKILKLAGKP